MKAICEDTGGNQLVLGWFPPLWLRSVEGLGADYNVYTAKFGTQDGEYYAGSSAKMRNIVLVLDVNKANEPEQRQQLFAFFPPRSEGTFYYYADDDSPGRKISYYAEKVEPSGDGMLRHFTISLLCPDPLFSDLQTTQIPMSYWKKRLRFPFTMPGFSGSGNPLTFSGKGCKNVLETLKVLGKTGQKVTVQGKNLFDKSKITDRGYYVNSTDGNLRPNALYCVSGYILVAPNTKYFISNANLNAVQYDASKNYIPNSWNVVGKDSAYVLTTLPNAYYVRFSTPIANLDIAQMELGISQSAYAPFVPNSPSPDYPSPITGVTKATVNDVDYAIPQTLYDGDSYDYVSGTGQAVKTRRTVDGTKSWGYPTQNNPSSAYVRFYLSANAGIPLINTTNSSTVNCQCENLTSSTLSQIQGLNSERCGAYAENGYTRIDISILKSRMTGWSDTWTPDQKVAAFKSWLAANPVTVLYQLSTPTVITGTPQNIPVLPEDNAVSADGGSVSIRCLGVFKVAERIAEKIVTVYNNTNVAAGLLIYFTARGDVVNPGMTEVRTQKRFKLTARMMNGDTILVNTNQNEKGASFQEDPQYVDMWHFGDTWLQLQPGENVFQYFADSGADYLDVKIIYMPRYWGA